MSRPAAVIVLSPEEKKQLEGMLRRGKGERRYADRARMILRCAQGRANTEIGRELGVRPATVCKWRVRFEREGLSGLHDDFRPGRPAGEDRTQLRQRLLARLEESPPAGCASWSGPLLARTLGVKADLVWAQLRLLGISLQRRRSWCISTDPQFAQKAADVVGLYLGPPENAVVISMDEKPCIQALERTQGWLKLPNGQALSGFAHEYQRHGTTHLFAALQVATGQVLAGHYRRKRREEFLDFMDRVVAAHPGRELHVIVDNLSTHRLPPGHRWAQAHPQVHFHFTPTHASWLNQVEVWFSILTRQALRGASFRSVKELIAAMDAFITAYNRAATPFVWTKINVTPKSFAAKYADLIK